MRKPRYLRAEVKDRTQAFKTAAANLAKYDKEQKGRGLPLRMFTDSEADEMKRENYMGLTVSQWDYLLWGRIKTLD